MSINKTMISLAVIAAVAAVIAGGMARADRHAPAAPAGSAPSAGIVSHRSTDDPQQVRDYWTPERMRHARPAPMPSVGG